MWSKTDEYNIIKILVYTIIIKIDTMLFSYIIVTSEKINKRQKYIPNFGIQWTYRKMLYHHGL